MTVSTPFIKDYFKQHEALTAGSQLPIEQVLQHMPWNEQGLIPVIAQDTQTKAVLMLAWASREALLQTLTTGKAYYWSRSRRALWCKGESSGHTQAIHQVRLDCDGDALLYLVDQHGPACHTNRAHCFFWQLTHEVATVIDAESTRIEHYQNFTV